MDTPPRALSLSQPPVVMRFSVNTSHGGVKKDSNHGKILAGPSLRQNTDKKALYGEKGVKNLQVQDLRQKM